MARLVKCDLCGEDAAGCYIVKAYRMRNGSEVFKSDICDDCLQELQEFLKVPTPTLNMSVDNGGNR